MPQKRISNSRAGRRRGRRFYGHDRRSRPEKFHHQDVVVVGAVLLQRIDLVTVRDEAGLGIEPPRGLVLRNDRQLKLLNMAGGMGHGSVDKAHANAVLACLAAHIHAPQNTLWRCLASSWARRP